MWESGGGRIIELVEYGIAAGGSSVPHTCNISIIHSVSYNYTDTAIPLGNQARYGVITVPTCSFPAQLHTLSTQRNLALISFYNTESTASSVLSWIQFQSFTLRQSH
jgi:hypothetical protein